MHSDVAMDSVSASVRSVVALWSIVRWHKCHVQIVLLIERSRYTAAFANIARACIARRPGLTTIRTTILFL